MQKINKLKITYEPEQAYEIEVCGRSQFGVLGIEKSIEGPALFWLDEYNEEGKDAERVIKKIQLLAKKNEESVDSSCFYINTLNESGVDFHFYLI